MSQSASSSQHSISAPSPAPSSIDEDEILADEEMMHCIRRQQTKKLAAGATQQELDDLLKFPEPIPPAPGQTPESKLEQGVSNFEG
jgi:dual specificity tyrosine-phosphorylation-regulated kinase 2/3/4